MQKKQGPHPFIGEAVNFFGQTGTITDYDRVSDSFLINNKIRITSRFLRETGELEKLNEKHGLAAPRTAKIIVVAATDKTL